MSVIHNNGICEGCGHWATKWDFLDNGYHTGCTPCICCGNSYDSAISEFGVRSMVDSRTKMCTNCITFNWIGINDDGPNGNQFLCLPSDD